MIALAALPSARAAPLDLPYDETADAAADVAAAFATARAERKPVLLVFGANWCLGCRLLHEDMTEPELARFIDARFVVVKVDVGNWQRNLDLAAAWGDPIADGLPGLVLATPEGETLLAARSTRVAAAQRLDPGAFRTLFEELARSARDRGAR